MTFREQVQLQASKERRKMVRTGALLTQHEFLTLLGMDERRFERLVAAGSVFALEVDDAKYFPAVLGDAKRDLKRLHSICRILVPAPSACRLVFLEGRQAPLGNLSPLDMLDDPQLYRSLRKFARAWAAEWSRTFVKIYAANYLEEPEDVEPIHTAVDEVDPRTNLWTRALGALQAGAYIVPVRGLQASEATVFITRNDVGNRPAVLEARVALKIASHVAHVEVDVPGATHGGLSVPLARSDNVVDVVMQAVEVIRKSDGQPD
ncbi:hypothetical protein [Paraburkholderia sp. Cpub6]|uniref:hypothetical protein n=1 Tax=Paraburkholderia sp. Cpub6 TaxID=2723094 RepID=UPI0016207377|nr:hypothetical protein [Paraburkholderia sp. Cpub6]MBB5460246.1 hypothetical protein [Paraburkholderia sp. Cpub6]